jgi:hypothetical protein
MIKGLAIVALLVGGTSLAIAQNNPPTGQPPASGQMAHHATKHHNKMHMSANRTHPKKMYMSTKGTHHKTMKPGQPAPKQQ